MREQQLALSLARRTDPTSSKRAAAHAVASGLVESHEQQILRVLRLLGRPATTREIATWCDLDRYQVARRTRKMVTRGLLREPEETEGELRWGVPDAPPLALLPQGRERRERPVSPLRTEEGARPAQGCGAVVQAEGGGEMSRVPIRQFTDLLDTLGLPYELLPPQADGLLPGFRLPCGCGYELRGPKGAEEHYTVCGRPACPISPALSEIAEEEAATAKVELERR